MSCITELLKMKGNAPFLKFADKGVIEGGGKYHGYEWIVTFVEHGHRCGYVALPSEHPFNRFDDTYDMPVDCHGGVTFCSRKHRAKEMLTHYCNDLWMGFDCAHYGDAKCIETSEKYFGETEWTKVVKNEPHICMDRGEIHKSFKYVERHCKKVIRQLIKASKNQVASV